MAPRLPHPRRFEKLRTSPSTGSGHAPVASASEMTISRAEAGKPRLRCSFRRALEPTGTDLKVCAYDGAADIQGRGDGSGQAEA